MATIVVERTDIEMLQHLRTLLLQTGTGISTVSLTGLIQKMCIACNEETETRKDLEALARVAKMRGG